MPSTETLLEAIDDLRSTWGIRKRDIRTHDPLTNDHVYQPPAGISPLKPGDPVLVYCPQCLRLGVKSHAETRLNPASMTSEPVECPRCHRWIPPQGTPNRGAKTLDRRIMEEVTGR